ncbi:MAG: apolipoprotein N-acyltransferase [Gammaproteobacteria bacterium]|nr:MAG: apolipoprotein N-acyltransferase [Gammaproteobacteria bacterium]
MNQKLTTELVLDLLALLAGAAMILAFSPFEWWPVAIISLAVLIQLMMSSGPGRAFWRGWLFGLGMFGAGVSWVFVSIRQFGNADTFLSTVITVLLVFVMALYPAIAAWLSRRLPAPGDVSRIALIFPAIWILIEWLREWLFTGFPWLQAGYALIDSPVAMLGPLTGVMGITLTVAMSAAFAVVVIRKGVAWGYRILAGLGLVLLWGAPFVVDVPTFSKPIGEPSKVALVQGNIEQHVKWVTENRRPTLALYRALTEQHWRADIVVWPETAVPAYEDTVSEYLDALHYAAQVSDTALLVGIPVRETHGDRYFNALAVYGGEQRGQGSIYYKQHLVPFGEYLPFKQWLDPVLGYLEIPMSDFSAGDQGAPIVDARGHIAGISICFEDIFGEEVRQALPQAHYLVNVSNDAWFGNSLAPHQHLQMARMRALETSRYLLRTAIIEPDGQIQGQADQFRQQVLTGKIQAMQGSTPYVGFGHYPVLLLSLLMLIVTGWLGYRKF